MAEADKSPHSQTISLVISVLALLISAASFFQSNRTAHVTRDTVRPDIAIEGVKFSRPWNRSTNNFPIELVLKNHGATGAANVGAFVTCQIDYTLKENNEDRTVMTGRYALTVDRLAAGQGQTRMIPCSATIPKMELSKVDSVHIMWLHVELRYDDSFTDVQNHYTDLRCFSLHLEGTERVVGPGEFKPCDVYLHELNPMALNQNIE
jgi:hypothetical protein